MSRLKRYIIFVSPLIIFFGGCLVQRKLLTPTGAVFKKISPPVFRVLLHTSKGDISIEVQRAWSPHGADRFYNLVKNGFYDGAAVFRIRTSTWAQFGIPGNPQIAQAWRMAYIPDDPRVISNTRGTIAYAFKDPDARSTQVFINLRDNSATHDTVPFVPFAKVLEGMTVADALYADYGEKAGGGIRAGHQDSLFTGGNAYLLKNFPLLDYIIKATIQ